MPPRRIADGLNRRGVPSPGARWNRSDRRGDGEWLASAIYGDPKRGSGVLSNELYHGVRVWNRRRRDRDPETERKVFKARPLSERVRGRQRTRSQLISAAVRGGLCVHAANGRAGAAALRAKAAKLRSAIENLTDALATIGLRNDPTLADRLVQARGEWRRSSATLGPTPRSSIRWWTCPRRSASPRRS